jgi:hypothetical protein
MMMNVSFRIRTQNGKTPHRPFRLRESVSAAA